MPKKLKPRARKCPKSAASQPKAIDPNDHLASAIIDLVPEFAREDSMGVVGMVRKLVTAWEEQCNRAHLAENSQQGILLSKGTRLIAGERRRQVEKEGWTREHDRDDHDAGDLATAAACYLKIALEYSMAPGVNEVKIARRQLLFGEQEWPIWPWEDRWFKPKNKVRDLVRAGALIAAELDRELRDREERGL